MKQKTVLTIAGSDPSGGAGIQADLKTMEAFDVYGMSVITALTAQNTLGVSAVMNVEHAFVEKQLEAVLSDIQPDAVKIGMLPDRNIMEVVCRAIDKYKIKNVVLDPVLSSTSGTELSRNSDLEYMIKELFKRCTLITPNIPEVEKIIKSISAICQDQSFKNMYISSGEDYKKNLVRIDKNIFYTNSIGEDINSIDEDICSIEKISSKEDMELAARIISDFCGCSVLIKGGHSSFAGDDSSDDLLYLMPGSRYSSDDLNIVEMENACDMWQERGENLGFRRIWLTGKRIDNSNTHGTGCTLSSAIACGLAKGKTIEKAMSLAKDYITECISMGLDLGHGRGPLYH
ncbi:bifunctional hydroxymethylpyrimidine kinase/phosphomethylpyrimidine kinase [Butyrivibrio sp. INlla14]|uniref:bifunctional hydroxymethylpyrimidine kinase/phosphomethylpyrimidine kinase n=1 Tax=Butyrivibrio sp. INlla14 TaxID=1520808 RepID=UPI00087652C9|nr:hydroxymethylpyrimidine/phosphomethylpyrimidine kinase [Butyrivibrio sp. INlla14]SCY18969.1 hydroxymethylpyrimidine kinase/phosphomethylpyrimidine kinase [Butyrivibrio sp. INlla14]